MITLSYNGTPINSLSEIDNVNAYSTNYILNVENLSEESGIVQEPATLDEAKAYLRLEGFDSASTGLAVQPALPLTLNWNSATVQSGSLVNALIISLTREGISYTQAGAPGNLVFGFDQATGTVTFDTVGNVGNESIGITYAYLTGGGTVDDFDFDDTLISDMITEAREWVENYTGVHCVPKVLQVVFCNGSGYIELPGPVTSAMSGGTTELTLLGSQFPKVKTPTSAEITTQYNAGYNAGNAPRWVKNAILAYLAWAFEHRGDETNLKGFPERAASVCRPHRRVANWR